MPNIFISYRREDSAGHTGRLFDRLSEHFGKDHVFMDIADIHPGLDFVEAIDRALGSCDAFVVVMGAQWATIADTTGRRRLENPEDFIRLEIARALQKNRRVIPALVQGAAMPSPQNLPADLRKLCRLQALELSDTRWDYDVGQLIETLEMTPGKSRADDGKIPARDVPSSHRFSRWLLVLAAGILLIGGGTATFLLRSRTGLEVRDPVSGSGGQASRTVREHNPRPETEVGSGRKGDVGVAAKVGARGGMADQQSGPAPVVTTQRKGINLLAPENGGQLLLVPSDHWLETIDGKENSVWISGEAVYAFKDERQATFDTFTVLIPETQNYNVKEFELLAGNDSPTGRFESIGRFQTQNIKFVKQPYQQFTFPPVQARYLKVKILSSHAGSRDALAYEVQLFGVLN
jgi:TIR domain